MTKEAVDKVKLSQMLRNGASQRECAKYFSVSPGRISQIRKELNISVIKNVALENAGRIVDKNLNAVAQLQRVNEVANQLLDELIGEDRVIDRMVKAVEGSLVYEGDPAKLKEHIRQVILRVNQDKNTALKACSEIRGQLKLQLEIFEALYNMKAVEEFQTEVLTTIGEASPEVRNAIISKLNQRRIIRQSVNFD